MENKQSFECCILHTMERYYQHLTPEGQAVFRRDLKRKRFEVYEQIEGLKRQLARLDKSLEATEPE